MDVCPERMDAADAEASMPLRIETAVVFWSGTGVESAVVDTCPERMEAGVALEAVVDAGMALEAVVDACFFALETVEDTCPMLKSTERTDMGNLEAAEPVQSEAGMAFEAVLALEAVVALEAL